MPVVAMADSRPIVVIVGRPNVGKSALFNKLMRRREALVCDTPHGHMTRDVREGLCTFFGLRFRVFDTAGLEPATSASHKGQSQGQTGSGVGGRDGGDGGVGRVLGPSLLESLGEADRAAMEASILQRTAEITSYLLGQAVAVLFLVDARSGIQPADVEVADWLRRSVPKHRVVLLANKCEGLGGDSTGLLACHVAEAYSLGFGDPIPISAESGEGLEDLYAAVKGPVEERERDMEEMREERERDMEEKEREGREERIMSVSGISRLTKQGESAASLPDGEGSAAAVDDAAAVATALEMAAADASQAPAAEEEAEQAAAEALDIPLQLAIAGLPNVGKSTLVNSLLGAQRVLTGPEPGLTRDAVRIGITYQGKPMWLVDTAGWVKAAQARQRGPVSLARMDMERSIGRAHVVVLVLDAAVVAEEEKSLKTAERSLARWVWEEGRALVIAANKVDAVGEERDRRCPFREDHVPV
ncbi:hypothetical protein CLOM_g22368 [Closterium sp. NIES-68]|nr:hypothetical protein CLOM_g22368 [Closterium sp. NIES-68]